MDSDIPQQCPQQNQHIHPNYQMMRNSQTLGSPNSMNRTGIPIPVINIVQAVPHKQMPNTPINQVIRTSMANSPMSPLSLNIGSPMYSLPSSPSSYNSPAMSPAHMERVMSPYSTPQSLSPVGKYHQVYSPGKMISPAGVIQGCDPYLTTKMQPSPGFPMQTDMLLDSNVPLTTSDFWPDTDMLQGTNDLLTAFDDVKLV